MILVAFVLHCALLSLMTFGGATTVVPELHRFLVDTHHLMDGRTFTTLFALAQVSPGPNTLFIALFGWQIAGVPGALLGLAGLIGPTSLIALMVERVFGRHRDAAWMVVIRRGLTPVTIGLTTATGYILAHGLGESIWGIVLTALTIFIVVRTRINPVWLILAGGVIGMLGLL